MEMGDNPNQIIKLLNKSVKENSIIVASREIDMIQFYLNHCLYPPF